MPEISELQSLKEEIRSSIRLQPIFKLSKINAYESFLNFSLNYTIDHYDNFTFISSAFDSYETFIQYLLTENDIKQEYKTWNLINRQYNLFLINYLKMCNLFLDSILAYETWIIKLNKIIDSDVSRTFEFEQNFSIINKEKFFYTSMLLYDNKTRSNSEEFSSNSESYWPLVLLKMIDFMFDIDKDLLDIKVDDAHNTVWDVLNVYKCIFLIWLERLMQILSPDDDILKFQSYLKFNTESFYNLINSVLLKTKNIKYRTKFLREVIWKLGYNLGDFYNVWDIKKIDFKSSPLVFFWNNVYLPFHFIHILNPNRSFLSHINKSYNNIFNWGYFSKIFSDIPLKKLQKKFVEIKIPNVVLQKNINIKITNSDVDYSVFDKNSGTLMIFESKNFIQTHSMHDTLQKEKLSDSPIQKGIKQLEEKIIPFFKNGSIDGFSNFYWEKIVIKQIYWFVLTWNEFAWILSDPSKNIRVISLDRSLEILEKLKNNPELLFKNVDVLADYHYYLSTVKKPNYCISEFNLPLFTISNDLSKIDKDIIFKIPVIKDK
ncbi:MAG: hypothetical protein ACD_4C00076G0003 [uncultured bacterium (gcode 4)]|uniref:Uncharacterized protein n=1 Tax=uncultured bacterium (gcode 4) TaxID=1234023 RepID=K2GUN8_9BACT|nr:MAG: hypothetical protein ACD_4C00076G0003 [uncultured bacterium (gcode 4)]